MQRRTLITSLALATSLLAAVPASAQSDKTLRPAGRWPGPVR
ncbi:MAG: hypothetical protein ACKOXU_03115 [Limnohabitans sp.]